MSTFRTVSLFLLAIIPMVAHSQGGLTSERFGYIDTNRVKTVFSNWGVIGQPAIAGSRGAWKYPANGYIGDMSIMIGAQLESDGKTFHSVVTCPVMRPTILRDQNPSTGEYWTFEPDSGYCASGQSSPAISSRPETWPLVWPDHPDWVDGQGNAVWNGLNGPGTFAGTEECYFVLSDQHDKRFNYAAYNTLGVAFKPDTADTTRNGLGLQVGVRYIELNYPLFRDVLFRVFEITNEGKSDYDDVVFGILTGTYIGVTTTEDYHEYADDATLFYRDDNTVISLDFGAHIANPFWKGTEVGRFGEGFAETPTDNTIASWNYFLPANAITLGDDESLWNMMQEGQMSSPISIQNDTVALNGEDGDYLYGSKHFSLRSKETKRIVSILAYGDSTGEIIQKIQLARALWNCGMDTSLLKSFLTVLTPRLADTLQGVATIQWSTEGSIPVVDIWFSPDEGVTWVSVARNAANVGSFAWNTSNVPDCCAGVLRLFALDSLHRPLGFGEQHWLTIDNTHSVKPFVRILDNELIDTTVTSPSVSIHYFSRAHRATSLELSLQYRVSSNDPYTEFARSTVPSDTNEHVANLDLRALPNADSLSILLSASDGTYESVDTRQPFAKRTERIDIPGSDLALHGLTDATIEVHVRDAPAVVNDTYRITFDDLSNTSTKHYSIRSLNYETDRITFEPLHNQAEGRVFDGLSLWVEDPATSCDTASTHWSRTGLYKPWAIAVANFLTFPDHQQYKGYAFPADYEVRYSNGIIDTSTAREDLVCPSVPVNFQVWNRRSGTRERFCFSDLGLGFSDIFILQQVGEHDTLTWDVALQADQNPESIPRGGDTLFLITKKGISFLDTVYVSTSGVAGTEFKAGSPLVFALEQNFPNPFNPTTTIRYRIAVRSRVTLTIYDILGRQVAMLVDAVQSPGSHQIQWNASGIATGVYFCRLRAGDQVMIEKLLLLR
jgi:hypothetical protein